MQSDGNILQVWPFELESHAAGSDVTHVSGKVSVQTLGGGTESNAPAGLESPQVVGFRPQGSSESKGLEPSIEIVGEDETLWEMLVLCPPETSVSAMISAVTGDADRN